MSRTRKGSKGPGYEYWSKRPMAGMNPGAETKRMTHKLERIEAKDQIKEQLQDDGLEHDFIDQEVDEALYCHYYGPCNKCKTKYGSHQDGKYLCYCTFCQAYREQAYTNGTPNLEDDQ